MVESKYFIHQLMHKWIFLKTILQFTLKQLWHVSVQSHHLQGAHYSCLLKLQLLKWSIKIHRRVVNSVVQSASEQCNIHTYTNTYTCGHITTELTTHRCILIDYFNNVTLASTNKALPEDGVTAPKHVRAVLMKILILFFKTIQLCISWWVNNSDCIKLHGTNVKKKNGWVFIIHTGH